MYTLYSIKNKITEQVYIGITSIPPEQRWKRHQYACFSEKKKNDCPKFYNSMRKYGIDNFELSIIEQSENSEIIENLEIEYIKNTKNTLNVSFGGGGMTNNTGWKHSPETIEKLKTKKPPMLGKKHSEETIEKMKNDERRRHIGENNGMYGKNHTEEHKKKMSDLMKQNNPMKGKKHSKETIEKIRQAALRRSNSKGFSRPS